MVDLKQLQDIGAPKYIQQAFSGVASGHDSHEALLIWMHERVQKLEAALAAIPKSPTAEEVAKLVQQKMIADLEAEVSR